MLLLLSAVLFFSAGVLLVLGLLRQHRRLRQVTLRLQGRMRADHRFSELLTLLGKSRAGQRSISLDSETQALLNQIGWRRTSQRTFFAACQLGTPIVLMIVVIVMQSLGVKFAGSSWIAPILALGIGYLIPKRLLVMAAKRRVRQVVNEVSSFIPLLRILFESGLAVEQSLRVLSAEGQALLPVLSGELRQMLVRVDSGLELGEELNNTAALLNVSEFSDTCVIIRQLVHQGAGAMKSLAALKQLLDDRRLTRLQEYISKLSAKMSVVMMVFLFPALLIVLAGPGFTAMTRAFKTL
jgi:tight adherence protein C